MAVFGTGQFGSAKFGDETSIYSSESPASPSYAVAGVFGSDGFGGGFFGSGLDGAYTPAYTRESSVSPTYTKE